MVLAGACTIAGIALAHALVWLLTALAPSELPRADVILVDWRAVLVASTIAVGAAIGLGLVAAFVPLRLDLTTPLRSALRRDSAGGSRVERTLVVIQIALALVVLGGAGLLVRSLANLRQLDWGVSANDVLIAQLVPSDPRESQDVANYNRRLDDLITAVAAIPGVVSVAPILMAPFGGTAGWDARFLVEGQPEDLQSRQPLLNFEIATPEYFGTMGVQLIRGRVFSQDDRVDAPPVIVVSESVARMAWPNANPIGRRMKISGSPWATVIGVAADTRYRQLTRLRPTVYRPRAQFPTAPAFLAIRAAGELNLVVEPLRVAAQSAWPGMFFPSIRALHDYGAEPLAQPRFAALLLSGLALASLVWSVIGLYGVMSTFVMRRKREIGIRMALGSGRERVLRSVVREGMLLAVAGVAIGTGLALAMSQLMTALLFEIRPYDPSTFVTVVMIVGLTALLATYLPARLAAKIDPAVILRE
jgi:predicted permease